MPRGTETPLVLYDLKEDPSENQSFAEKKPEVVARLQKLFPPPNPDPNFGLPSYKGYGRKA